MNKSYHFYKYQGTGNDFILIYDEYKLFPIHDKLKIKNLCNRVFGIGADGFILLQNHSNYDFEMLYFNSDGKQSSMCGNGGRCIIAFAYFLKIINKTCTFKAIDGIHKGIVEDNNIISIEMNSVEEIIKINNGYFVNTGSPHYVEFVDCSLKKMDDFVEKAKNIRYNKPFLEEGVNVNFVYINDDILEVITYERGIENKTYSCGTGVVAASIIANYTDKIRNKNQIKIQTEGGELSVHFENSNSSYRNIWLKGPATFVFEGDFIL